MKYLKVEAEHTGEYLIEALNAYGISSSSPFLSSLINSEDEITLDFLAGTSIQYSTEVAHNVAINSGANVNFSHNGFLVTIAPPPDYKTPESARSI